MSVKHWLQSLNLDQYLSDFTRGGYTTIEQCSTLTDEKLQQLGMTLPGHKKRILAYLPTAENVQGTDEDHLYGNVPLPSGAATASSCIPKTSISHTYVNTSSITSEPIYGNVSMPSDTTETDSTQVPRHSIIGDHGVKDDSESFYDVLPPPCQLRKKEELDGGEYVNIAAPPLEGAVGGIDMPPMLPPKKNKGNRRSVDEIMGIIPPTDETLRRPVPKPRTTVGKGRPSLGSVDSSPRNSIVDAKKDATPPMLKPTPKPRPRPTPRGVKTQTRQDSASSCSYTSDSPRHSVNASPVSLPSPMHRDPSPDMPKEQLPVPPKPEENKTSEKMIRPLSVENVPSPEVPEKREICSPPKPEENKTSEKMIRPLSVENVPSPEVPVKICSPPKPPVASYEPQLSMETEVPPAEDQFPSQTCQRKIPIPLKCFNDNNNMTDSEKITSEVTSWKDNELYETADDTRRFADPGEPEKLDDFIKSIMPKASGIKTDSNSSPDVIQAEEIESEELYQVPLPVIEIQPEKTTVSSTVTTITKTSATTSSPSLSNGNKKEAPKSNDNKTSSANTNNKSPEPSNPHFSTFTTGWDKSRGQARDPPTKSGDRVATPSGGDLSKTVGSVSSESDIDRDKHDSVYGAVWFATSGEAIHGKQQPEPSVAGGQDVYEELDPEPHENSRELRLSLKKKQSKSERASVASSLDSSLSFNVPEPAFTPPPLPAGTQLENFTKAAIAQATSQNRPPPAVPPRPKNVPLVGTRSTSETGSTSSLSSAGTSSSSNLLGPGGMPSPNTHRVSAMSFTNLAMERVDSSRGATGGNDDDRYELVEVSTISKSRKPPRPPLAASMKISRSRQGNHRSNQPGNVSRRHSTPQNRNLHVALENAEPKNRDELSNIYSPEPFGISQPRCPPAPPPRSTQPPLSDLFNRSGLSSAGFHDDMSDGASMGSVWESDDTLSDGGEFYESSEFFKHHKPASTNNQIPVFPSTPSALQKDKEGVCYKYGSLKSRRRGWQKRWVQFDGKTLKYYHDEKSPVSKRVIPVSSMVNVEQNIKQGEVHGYGFKVITVDRVYSFSVDDADELALWTCLLMKAIIDHDDKFIEGGQMSDPDLEGFVRMEGVKGKRYLAIKGDLMAYYNTYNDYKAGCPIHVIQMKLASVKNAGKNKLELRTPYATYGLHYDSNEELVNWKNAMEESITEGLAEDSVLNDVYENHSNRYCADCGSPDPHWASINLGVTICKHCAGIHRMLTMPFSKVRSLRMDVKVWTPTLIQLIKQLGNDNANNFWEWNSNEDNRIDSDSDINERRDYISSKYEEKMFCRLHPLHNDESAMNEALCKSVQYDDVFETMQLIFSGADILCTTNQYGGENETPSQLARKAKQTTQMEFLYQNGAEGSGNFPATTSIRSGSDAGRSPHLVKMKGYLLKTGPNQKDFHKRWCILEHGIFTYFENEKTLVAKDSILRHEMISLAKVQDERQEFTFELGTTKAGGRVYLFGADHFDERQKWLVKIAKNFAPLPIEGLDHIRDLDRAGIVFLREGATTDWQTTWIQLKGRCLSIFNKENKVFEEIDLRKIIGIKSLNATDGDDMFQDKSPPFVIDLPKRALYIKGDASRETKAWLEILEKITAESGGYLIEQQLTVEEVPVIVDKCINFISTHGMKVEGIYRKNGVHSKVSHLLQLFTANAREVHLRLDDYDVHDVGTTLKRYFRSLQEPLLTTFLYAKWTNTCNISDFGAKMQWYKYLLGELPTVHYSTLKRVISHLARLTDYQDENKMTKINLASIFGPVLMNPDKDDGGEHNTTTGFGATQQEINVVLDLLDNNIWLFEVKDDELEHERKMQEAMEKIQRANEFRQSQAGELLMGVYINTKEGDAVTLKVSPDMTGEALLDYVSQKAELDPNTFWGLYEVICDGVLERPIHFLEKVLDVTLRWTEWPEEFCRDNHLIVKPNYVYENVDNVFDPHFSLFEELKYSDKKSFKKYCFEFSQFKLTYQKDPRATTPINSWNVEDLIMYVGVDQKRSPPTKNALTFILHKEKITKNKDTPYFGHSLCFNTPEDQYRWLAAMLHAQHPGGLTRDGPPTATSAHGLDTHIPSPHLGASEDCQEYFQKWLMTKYKVADKSD